MNSASLALPLSAANSPAPTSRGLSVGSILLRIVFLVLVACTALVTLAVWSFWPRGDTRALRQAVTAAMPGHWQRQFEFRVGGPIVGLAEAVAYFAPMPDEAKEALGALDCAEVSLAQAHGPVDPAQRAAAFAAARATMLKRGWEPTVLVNDGATSVAVFTRAAGFRGDRISVCTLVVDGPQLVVANATIDPVPLGALVQKALAEAKRGH